MGAEPGSSALAGLELDGPGPRGPLLVCCGADVALRARLARVHALHAVRQGTIYK